MFRANRGFRKLRRTTWRELVVSPDGSQVVTSEFVGPVELLLGRLSQTRIDDMSAGGAHTVWRASQKDAFENGVVAPWIILGPGGSYALVDGGAVRGCLANGAPFKTTQLSARSELRSQGGRVRSDRRELSLEDGKVYDVRAPSLPTGAIPYRQDSPTGEKTGVYVQASPKVGEVSVYLLGPNPAAFLLGSFRPQPNRAWPPVCWKEYGDAVLASIPAIEKRFQGRSATVGRPVPMGHALVRCARSGDVFLHSSLMFITATPRDSTSSISRSYTLP